MQTEILDAVSAKGYRPLKAKQLAKRLGVTEANYAEFRDAVKSLVRSGQLDVGQTNTLRMPRSIDGVTGIYRRTASGHGYVRPPAKDGVPVPDIFIRGGRERDASTGDEVVVEITRPATKMQDAAGEVIRITQRATRTFVGTYFERDGQAFVRVDGTVFAHSILVGDPGAKGVKSQDKVVIDMIRFPSADDRGEGVLLEVLGPLNEPGVDLMTIIKAYNLPEEFPEEVMDEARAQADKFREDDLDGRTDFTGECVITIDPADARDFDDAVSVTIDPKSKHWVLTVHIADVGHFAPSGGALDTEAKKRATSIYLPRKVIPMFPEIISNGLASLQEGKLRYVKTVRIEFTKDLQKAHIELFNGVIKAKKRFAYEQVQSILNDFDGKPNDVKSIEVDPEVLATLKRMRDLAALLRKKRFRRGSLELSMPEAVLEYDADGRVNGAHFAVNDESHRMIEECMLAANEAVAEHFTQLNVPFLRRVHPMPNEDKLEKFAEFAKLLGYPMKQVENRFELQRVLKESADKPERAAIHYCLLRSLKQATYSPIQDEHYALASQHYCHFTSPIRRYPDLTVHRLLDRWLKTRKAVADENELKILGDHCSKMERRAETAERELVKLKLLQYMATRIGETFDAVITGVADYGFFAQAEQFPAEGLVHISSLTDDYYRFDSDAHTLSGGHYKKRFRLGDRVRVVVSRVDLQRRMLDFRIASDGPVKAAKPSPVKGSQMKPEKKPKPKRRR
ncbi:VacB/RNase II family 3'-5' exoribonuclease [soil metagenome]